MASRAAGGDQRMRGDDFSSMVSLFVTGCSQRRRASASELTGYAITLFTKVPVSRHAVLEYFAQRFDDAAAVHIAAQAKLARKNAPTTEHAIQDDGLLTIQQALVDLLRDCLEYWAPLISRWTVDLLGRISQKLVAGNSPLSIGQNSLEETLQTWMNCSATSILIDITVKCFSAMVDESASVDPCVDALLEASLKYSPHFDWVVAHLGSCFPAAIISRVLAVGLQAFVSQDDKLRAQDKLASVVGILTHLAGHHRSEIRTVLIKFYSAGIEGVDAASLATVPFLLHLTSIAPVLLGALSADWLLLLSAENLQRVERQFGHAQFARSHDCKTLLSLLVYLVMQNGGGSADVFSLLARYACDDAAAPAASDRRLCTKSIADTSQIILDSLLLELQRAVYGRCSTETVQINFLASLSASLKHLCQLFESLPAAHDQQRSYYSQVLLLLSVYSGPRVAAAVLIQYLRSREPRPEVLAEFYAVCAARLPLVTDSVTQAVVADLSSQQRWASCPELTNVVRHLSQLLDAPRAAVGMLRQSLAQHVVFLSHLLATADDATVHLLAVIKSLVGSSRRLPLHVSQALATALVQCLLHALALKSQNEKAERVRASRMILCRICKCPVVLACVLKLVFAAAFSEPWQQLLGPCGNQRHASRVPNDQSIRLSEQNRMAAVHQPLAPTLSVTLLASHAGNRQLPTGATAEQADFASDAKKVSKDDWTSNCRLLVDVVYSCCSGPGPVDADGPRLLVSSLIVRSAMPDVIGEMLTWPDLSSQQARLHAERDLYCQRVFDDHPTLWHMLHYALQSRTCFPVLSCVVRALLAAVAHTWSSIRCASPVEAAAEFTKLQKMTVILEEANLLPHPLCNVSQLFQHVSPYEVFMLLSMAWRYVHVAMMSGQVECALDPRDRKQLLSIVQNNVHRIGNKSSLFIS